MPQEQKSAAKETRQLIADTVGSYSQIKAWSGGGSQEKDRYASNLAAGGVTLQWVRGDASRAERSFHTINTEQTPIGDLEVRLIRDRRCPNVMATRALIQAGTGQYSTSSLPEQAKAQIKKLASDIYGDLFMPPLEDPIKTLDLPVAGRSYSSDSVKLILDLVEFPNGESDPKALRKKRVSDILSPTMPQDVHVPPDQADGVLTTEFLKKVRKASSRIAGTKSESLGLHPAVYFYTATGSYQPTAFLAAISFVMDMEQKNELVKFVKIRRDFEDLILKHKYFINQIVTHYGSGHRSLGALTKLFRYFFDGVISNRPEDIIVPKIVEQERMEFLKPIVDSDKGTKKDFTSERKSAVYLRQAINTAAKCGVCGARVHVRSMSIDHIQTKHAGGVATVDNGQLSHPFCNLVKDQL